MSIDTKQIALNYRMSHWARIIQKHSESGMNIKSFCDREGFHENRFYYWRKKLREFTCEQTMQLETNSLMTNKNPQRFSEIILSDKTHTPPIMDICQQSNIRIDASGIIITAGSDYPTNKLMELIKGLASL